MDAIQSNEVDNMVPQLATIERLVNMMKSLQIHPLVLGLVVQVRNVCYSHKLCQLRSWQCTWKER